MNTTNNQINKYYQSALIFLFVYLLIGLFALGLFPPVTQADGISLSLSPSLFQIDALPPADVRVPLTIANQNDSTVKLKVVYKYFKASGKNNGDIEYIGDKEPYPGAD